MEKVSVIIPSFNRFELLLNSIKSVKNQLYPNLEIIVINDGSSQFEYYEYDWKKNGIKIIHLKTNSKQLFGFACIGHVRNMGVEISSGKYIAFLDDDDIWINSEKINLQLSAMKSTNCKISGTDGLIGKGKYVDNAVYKIYNAEYHFDTIRNIYKKKNSFLFDNGFPEIWDLSFLKIHNCLITSSVIVEKNLLTKIGNFKHLKNAEDYDCWLNLLEHTNCVYLDEKCFYYDDIHGYGQNYLTGGRLDIFRQIKVRIEIIFKSFFLNKSRS